MNVLVWLYNHFDWRRFPKIEARLEDYVYGADFWKGVDDGEIMYCQDCGCIIEWDIDYSDDVVRPAYVTASGDLFCSRCGRAYDEEEERLADEEWGWMPGPWDD